MLYKTNEEEEKEFKNGKRGVVFFLFFILIIAIVMMIWEQYWPPELPDKAGIEDLYHQFRLMTSAGIFLFLFLLVLIADQANSLRYYRRRLEATIKIIQDTDEIFAECFENPDYWRETPVKPADPEEISEEKKDE